MNIFADKFSDEYRDYNKHLQAYSKVFTITQRANSQTYSVIAKLCCCYAKQYLPSKFLALRY